VTIISDILRLPLLSSPPDLSFSSTVISMNDHDPLFQKMREPLLVAHEYDHHQEKEDEEVLEGESTRMQLNASVFSSFKKSALLLGVLIGVLIQLSTLGANYLVMTTTIWGGRGGADDDYRNKSSNQDITMFTIIWSVFISALTIIILFFLRNIVSIAYLSVLKKSHQEMVEEMILQMECHFVIGALIGICMAWALSDALIGLKTYCGYSIVILGVTGTSCRVMTTCLARRSFETTTRHVIMSI
jgi:hypothetical protein